VKRSVYLETSVIGYLTSRPSRDLLTAANQQITYDWWNDRRIQYDLFVSQFVVAECGSGDVIAAQERMKVLADIAQLETTTDVDALAIALLTQIPLPQKAQVDALHIAVAAVHGMDYLLTWNCKHIANAAIRSNIERICRSKGFDPPTICTPQELMET